MDCFTLTYSNLLTHSQSTLDTGRAIWRDGTVAIAAFGKRPVDVVCPELSTSCDDDISKD